MSSARHDDILQGFVQENMKNLGNRNLKDRGPNKLKPINDDNRQLIFIDYGNNHIFKILRERGPTLL